MVAPKSRARAARPPARALWSFVLCPALACSVINSFDEVVPASNGGSAGTNSAGSAGTAGSGGDMSSGGGGSGGSAGADPDAGPEAPVTPLIVVAGTQFDAGGGDTRVLSVLDPETGAALSTEPLSAAGLAFDAGTNLWYVFLSDDFPADPATPVDMQVRRWNGQAWVTLATVPAIPPPRPDGFAVLNQRLAYLSWRIGLDDAPVQALTILDTSNPTSIVEINVPSEVLAPIDFGKPVIDLVGTPGRPNDASALGGDLALLLADGCATVLETECGLVGQPITVGTSISRGLPRELLRFTGKGAVAEPVAGDALLVASVDPDQGKVVLNRFASRSLDPVGAQLTTTSVAAELTGAGFDDCLSAALFAEGAPGGADTDTSLFGISLVNALGNRHSLGRPREGVYYEPSTRTLLVPYRGGDPLPNPDTDAGAGNAGVTLAPAELVAFRVGASGTSVSLTERAAPEWEPPPRLWVHTAEVSVPRDFACP